MEFDRAGDQFDDHPGRRSRGASPRPGRSPDDASAEAESPDWREIAESERRWREQAERQREELIAEACLCLRRNLSREEWVAYLGDEPYRLTCPNLP